MNHNHEEEVHVGQVRKWNTNWGPSQEHGRVFIVIATHNLTDGMAVTFRTMCEKKQEFVYTMTYIIRNSIAI